MAIEGLPTLLQLFAKSLPIGKTICTFQNTQVAKEMAMFEAAQEQKRSSASRMWMAIFVIAAAVAVGAVLYTMPKGGGKPTAPVTAATAPPVAAAKADPVRDLKILSARMEKDRAGTTAVWLVDVNNKSNAYTYSSIQYETTYVGPDNAALLVNKGTIPFNLAPGEERNAQIRDVLYPAGTAWYKFRITGATPSVQ
jgi:hypothetical protein